MLAPPRQFPAASPFSRRCTRNCRRHGRYPTRAKPRCRVSRPTCISTWLRRGATSPFPQVEDAVAGYLLPASPTMRLGQKPLLPTRVGRHQAQLAEKSYLAAGQAACTTNTAALLQRYQAKLLTELALSLGEDHP